MVFRPDLGGGLVRYAPPLKRGAADLIASRMPPGRAIYAEDFFGRGLSWTSAGPVGVEIGSETGPKRSQMGPKWLPGGSRRGPDALGGPGGGSEGPLFFATSIVKYGQAQKKDAVVPVGSNILFCET